LAGRAVSLPALGRFARPPHRVTSFQSCDMSFLKIMALVSVLTRDPEVSAAAAGAIPGDQTVALASAWPRLMRLVQERPTTGVVLDSAVSPSVGSYESALGDLATRFPSVWIVLVARRGMDLTSLFRLGQVGIKNLVLTHLDELRPGVSSAAQRAFRLSTEALVTRAVSPYVPAREMRTVRLALRGAQLGWRTPQIAERLGVSQAHLSVRLKSAGLPSAGHLLGWAKLLHAGRWLSDPGRSGESISRQLDYSNGAVFRRALRNYTSCTPTEVREGGGLAPVLDAFLKKSGLGPRKAPVLSLV